MLKNRLVELLQVFSRKEMTRFHEFSMSPYHNKHQDVRALIAYLNGIYPKFTVKNCHRTTVFKQVFPDVTYDKAALAIVFTYAFRLAEHFLVQELFQKKEGLSNIFLLQHLRKKEQYQHYERVLQKLDKNFTKTTIQNSDHYHLKFIFAAEADTYYAQRSRYETDLQIQTKQDNLDYFYLSQKLRDACEMLVRSNILKVDYSTSLLNAVVVEVANNEKKYKNIPAIMIYFRIYQMLSQQTVAYYHAILDMLKFQASKFSKDELRDIYNYLQHFSAESINRGDKNAVQSYFDLYKQQLEKGLLIENNYLSEWHYKNIVTIGTRVQATDWVYQFIENYKDKLDPTIRENAYRFNLAAYCYAVQKYDQVLDLLLTVEYKDNRYIQGVKALLLRTYYDLNEEEALFSLIDSFRQYIKRDRNISENRKKGFSNLLKFTKRAFVLKTRQAFSTTKHHHQALQKLITDIDKTAPIFNQTWLLGKVGELE